MTWSPGLTLRDAGADLLDDARGLVAQHHRQRQRPVAVHDVPVAVADARGLDPDARLAGLGPLLLDVDDLERRVRLVEDGSFHRRISFGELHLLEHRAAQEAVGLAERLDDLEVVVALADQELHRLAGRRHGRGEVARLALELRRLERAVG